jgi:hypothetical protein
MATAAALASGPAAADTTTAGDGRTLTMDDLAVETADVSAIGTLPPTFAVSGNLTVAAGDTLELAAGTAVEFAPSTGLTVHGALRSLGTSADPVVLRVQQTGNLSAWAGIACDGASAVVLRNTSLASSLDLQVRGTSGVDLSNITYEGRLYLEGVGDSNFSDLRATPNPYDPGRPAVWAFNSTALYFVRADLTAGYGWGDIPTFDIRNSTDIGIRGLVVRTDNFQLTALAVTSTTGVHVHDMTLTSGPGGGAPGQVLDAESSTGILLEEVNASVPSPVGAFYGVSSNVTVRNATLPAQVPWSVWRDGGILWAVNSGPLRVAAEPGATVESWGLLMVEARYASGGPVRAGDAQAVNASFIRTSPILDGRTGWMEVLLWRNASASLNESSSYRVTATCNCTQASVVLGLVEGVPATATLLVGDDTPPSVLVDVPPLRTGQWATLDAGRSIDNDGVSTIGWSVVSGPAATGLPCAQAACDVRFDAPGTVTLIVLAVDPTGNRAERTVVAAIADVTAPALQPLVVPAGPVDQEAPFAAHVEAHDNDPAFMAVVQWFLDGVRVTGDGDNRTFSVGTVGAHTIAAVVGDASGNHARVEANVTVRDSTAPTIAAWSPSSGGLAVRVIALDGTIASDNVGVVEWSWHVAGPGAEYDLTGPDANATLPGPGRYDITLTAKDAAGNTANRTFSVTVDAPETQDLLPVLSAAVGAAAVAAVAILWRARARKPPAR